MFCLDLAACIPILILKMDTSKINEKEKKKVNEANLVEELVALLKHHGDLQSFLKNTEQQLYMFEGSYLLDTSENGNIVKGWNKSREQSDRGRNSMANIKDKRNSNKRKVKDADRIFSYSSITAPMMNYIGDNENENGDSDTSAEEETDEDTYPNFSKKAKVVTKSKFKNMAKRRNH